NAQPPAVSCVRIPSVHGRRSGDGAFCRMLAHPDKLAQSTRVAQSSRPRRCIGVEESFRRYESLRHPYLPARADSIQVARFWECELGFLPIRSESPGLAKFLDHLVKPGTAIANRERPDGSDIFFAGIPFPLDTRGSRPQDRETFDRTKGLSAAG